MADRPRYGYDIPSGDLIDFHCHMLPEMDDGSKSLDMSVKMIDMSVRQGVFMICMTPHFYADRDDPEKFFARRNAALFQVKNKIKAPYPIITMGSEVHYFNGICSMERLGELRIIGTELLLIEMPFLPWNDRMVSDIVELNTRTGYQVVLAHIERYFNYSRPEMVDFMRSRGVLIQSNADFFTGSDKRKAMQMLADGEIHLLGSDSHNLTTRQPNLKEGYDSIRERLGDEAADSIKFRSVELTKHLAEIYLSKS